MAIPLNIRPYIGLFGQIFHKVQIWCFCSFAENFNLQIKLVPQIANVKVTKNTGPENCDICGRPANLTHFVSPHFCGFALCKTYLLDSYIYMGLEKFFFSNSMNVWLKYVNNALSIIAKYSYSIRINVKINTVTRMVYVRRCPLTSGRGRASTWSLGQRDGTQSDDRSSPSPPRPLQVSRCTVSF